jgi:hypothetical protein
LALLLFCGQHMCGSTVYWYGMLRKCEELQVCARRQCSSCSTCMASRRGGVLCIMPQLRASLGLCAALHSCMVVTREFYQLVPVQSQSCQRVAVLQQHAACDHLGTRLRTVVAHTNFERKGWWILDSSCLLVQGQVLPNAHHQYVMVWCRLAERPGWRALS